MKGHCNMMMKKAALAALLSTLGAAAIPAHAADTELNVYSARHYQTDEALYGNFTKQTGIKVNRIEAKEDELLERIRNEGVEQPCGRFRDGQRLAPGLC